MPTGKQTYTLSDITIESIGLVKNAAVSCETCEPGRNFLLLKSEDGKNEMDDTSKMNEQILIEGLTLLAKSQDDPELIYNAINMISLASPQAAMAITEALSGYGRESNADKATASLQKMATGDTVESLMARAILRLENGGNIAKSRYDELSQQREDDLLAIADFMNLPGDTPISEVAEHLETMR